MNDYMVYVYIIIVAIAVISSFYKKFKQKSKTNTFNQNKQTTSQTTTQYNKPQSTPYNKPQSTQPKSLEDILQTILNGNNPQKVYTPKVEAKKEFADKPLITLTPPEDSQSLEKAEKDYYGYDTELEYNKETEDYDKTTDHRLHGVGFDNIKEEPILEEESEWASMDWQKAIITAEILKRPEY